MAFVPHDEDDRVVRLRPVQHRRQEAFQKIVAGLEIVGRAARSTMHVVAEVGRDEDVAGEIAGAHVCGEAAEISGVGDAMGIVGRRRRAGDIAEEHEGIVLGGIVARAADGARPGGARVDVLLVGHPGEGGPCRRLDLGSQMLCAPRPVGLRENVAAAFQRIVVADEGGIGELVGACLNHHVVGLAAIGGQLVGKIDRTRSLGAERIIEPGRIHLVSIDVIVTGAARLDSVGVLHGDDDDMPDRRIGRCGQEGKRGENGRYA